MIKLRNNYGIIRTGCLPALEPKESLRKLSKVDGEIHFIPCDPANRHYAEILKQVAEGTLTIKDAD